MGAYQKLIKHVLWPLDLWRQGDYSEFRHWKEFERTQFLGKEELNALIWERLKRILELAYRRIPYYKATFDEAGIVPSDIKTFEDMSAVPMLDKRQLQRHLTEMVDPDWPKEDLIRDKTGGSTGTPVHYYYSRDRRSSRAAAALRHDRWAGYEIGQRKAGIWGAARDMPVPGWKKRLKSLLFPKSLLLNSVLMTPESAVAFNEQLKRYRPPVIVAYASSMALFARMLKKENVQAYRPTGIITSAEVLTPEDRKVIEEVMGAPVFNRLGCRDVSIIASECDRHDGLHLCAEALYVEIIRDNRPAKPGEIGEIVITDMLNDPMPLIRYRIGDSAALMEGECACGRQLPRLDKIEGRVTDFLVALDGRLCSGVGIATFIVANRPSLGQIQIIQDERERVVYRIGCQKRENISDDDLTFLREQTELYLGKGIQVDYEFVDSIPHEASGKYRFSISKVAGEIFNAS